MSGTSDISASPSTTSPYPQAKSSSWDSCTCNKDMIISIVVGIALTAIAAVAAYFCIVNGLKLWDVAETSLGRFGAAFLLYSGAAFSLTAAANAFSTGGRIICHDESKEFEYKPAEAKMQIGASILAPLVVLLAIPALLICCKR